MLNLQTLAGLLRDEELRQKLTRITSAKIKADIKALQANAELARRLVDGSARARANGDAVAREEMLKALVNEHLDYYGTIIDLSAAFSDRLLTMLAALKKESPLSGTAGPALTMNLRGAPGSTLRAPFEIENNRSEPVTAQFRLTPYVSEDGSQLVAANHAFDPPQAVVPPGGKQRVEFVQPVAEGFTAGRDYLATISVEGLDAMQIVVRLHVDKPSDAARPAAAEAGAKAEKAAPTGGSAAPRKSAAGPRRASRGKGQKRERPAAKGRGKRPSRKGT